MKLRHRLRYFMLGIASAHLGRAIDNIISKNSDAAIVFVVSFSFFFAVYVATFFDVSRTKDDDK